MPRREVCSKCDYYMVMSDKIDETMPIEMRKAFDSKKPLSDFWVCLARGILTDGPDVPMVYPEWKRELKPCPYALEHVVCGETQ